MKILENINLKEYSTIKIGGVGKKIIFVNSTKELKEVLKKENNYFIIGNGSNVLFADKQINRTLISLKKMNDINNNNGILEVDAGVDIWKLIKYLRKNDLFGFEKIAGIPGTIGGLVYINAGAYGKEIFENIESVEIINENNELEIINKSDIKFSYRYTEFIDRKVVIVKVFLKFDKGFNQEEIVSLLKKRKERQPLNYPNIGCIFKNPKGDFAARLIQEVDLKGLEKGGAQISDLHSNFIINRNNASYEDILFLINIIIEKVKEKFGICLEKEIIIVDI